MTICPPYRILLGGKCVSARVTLNCVSQHLSRSRNDSMYFIYYHSELFTIDDLIFSSTVEGATFSKWKNSKNRNCYENVNVNFFIDNACPMYTMYYNKQIGKRFINELTVRMSNRDQFPNDYMYLTNYEIGQNVNCTDGVQKTYMAEDLEHRQLNGTQFILVKPTQTLYKQADIFFGISVITGQFDDMFNKTNMWVQICESVAIQNCPKINLDPRESKIKSDNNLFMTNETLNETSNFNKNSNVHSIQGVLSFAGNCLSEICLAFTIIVHIILPPLRTIPGRSVMALSLSLFLAQLLFQILGLPLKLSAGCFAVAVLQHYFWLSSFCWMMVLAFDLRSTFAKTVVVKDMQKRRKLFLLYNAC